MKKEIKCPFRREADYEKKLQAYLSFCETASPPRLPNVAGFCRFARIGRKEYALAAERFPRMTDIAELSFIDEAYNNKLPNSGATLGFVCSLSGEQREEKEDRGGISVILDGHRECDFE